jgi:hypothetical protein
MKLLFTILSFFCLTSCANSKDVYFTASTPATSSDVRTFLGIPLSDSVDFIRWNLTLNDLKYSIECNYGISKPNTNGFINGGKKISFNGAVKFTTTHYIVHNRSQSLKLAILNDNLLHIAAADNSLLKGNGGWSYALNNLKPVTSGALKLVAGTELLKDSMVYEGRTPCAVPGFGSKECYKLKWLFVFYADAKTNKPTTYRVLTANWRKDGGRKGSWKIVSKEDGRIFYQLHDENGNLLISFIKLDNGVLIFTDKKENLLVGDHDFSYTLNRK